MKRLLLTIAATCALCSPSFAMESTKSEPQTTEVKVKKKKKHKKAKEMKNCTAAQKQQPEQQKQAQQSKQAPENSVAPALLAANNSNQDKSTRKGDKGMDDDQNPSNPTRVNPDFRLV